MISEDKNQKAKRAPDNGSSRVDRATSRPLSDLEAFQKIDQLRLWTDRKIIVSTTRKNIPRLKPGEVRWVAVGENVGSELNGKGERFTRPVYVLKANGSTTFIGIPLTHGATKEGSRLVPIELNGETVGVVLSQIRCFSTFRTYGIIATLDKPIINKIEQALKAYLFSTP